jgi:organic hydroperoxide reductase OsmC/OhrA
MLGTLNGALEVRQVFLEQDALRAELEGVNELVDGLPLLREIKVHYHIRVPAEARERLDRALARHLEKCPTAASLRGAVHVSWTATIEEVAG